MRSDQEMLDLIIRTAREDDRIRAVVLNGSRASPSAPRDLFQDFDIVYFVTEIEPFWDNMAWIARFGELMILQMPELIDDPPPANDGCFVYLMQFTDGTRIDLTLAPVDHLSDDTRHDSQSLLLLDKDGRLPPLPPPSDRDYLPGPPTAKAFADCCNEFWWLCPSIAKGLWREEILYARHVMDQFARPQLIKMLTWYVGMQTGFSGNPGKWGKYLERWLEPERWHMLLSTYSAAGYAQTWEALLALCALFRVTAGDVASRFGFAYPHGDDARVSAHLRRVRALPQDATDLGQ